MLPVIAGTAPTISGVVEDVFTVAGSTLEMIQGNSLLLLFFAAPIVYIGIGVIKRLKR